MAVAVGAALGQQSSPERRLRRLDIQSLRAVAVLVVILDHVGMLGFPGGFVGVDVFTAACVHDELSFPVQLLLIGASFVGAAAMYHAFENPIRR